MSWMLSHIKFVQGHCKVCATAIFGRSYAFSKQNHVKVATLSTASAQPVQASQTPLETRSEQHEASTSGDSIPLHAQESRLMLVDAHALLYRFHFAYGPNLLTDERGRDTSIAFGFLQTLLALLELRPPPTHMAVVFDAKGKNFRHEMFADYKANRPPMPDEIKKAAPRIQELLSIMDIPVLRVSGIEADDVIGSLATRALSEGFAVAIASPDKLLRPPRKKDGGKIMSGRLVVYNQQSFVTEFGVQPSQWPDVLALCGDSADNIPGVPGIGIKGALGLIQNFGSLNSLLERSSEVSRKKQRELLSSEEGSAAARLGLELVRIQTRLSIPPVRMPFSELELRQPSLRNQEQVLDFLREMNFKQHTARVQRIWESGTLS